MKYLTMIFNMVIKIVYNYKSSSTLDVCMSYNYNA